MDPSSKQLRIEFLSREPLDKDHRLATTRASPYSPGRGMGLNGIRSSGNGHPQQLSAEWQQSFAAPVREEAEEPNADEAGRKHMEKEATQELVSSDGHHFLFAAVGIVFPAERDLTIDEVDDPMVGDGNAVGVAGQVMKNVLRSAERRFGVHDPVLTEERTKKGTESPFVLKRLKAAGEN